MIARLVRMVFRTEFLGPVLVILALQMLAYGISASLPGTDTTWLFTICLLAASIGWMLSKSRLQGRFAALFIAATGLAALWIVSARLALPLLEWIRSLGTLPPQIVPAVRENIPLDTAQVQEAWAAVVRASSALWIRWQTWLLSLNKNVTVNDALIRNLIWSFVMWCLAAWSGWYAARRNAVLALLPSIGLMAIVLSYSEYKIYSLWMIVILMLLLMGLWNYKNHTRQWETHRVDYSDSILYDNTQAVVFLALLIGAIAFSTPSISWRQIREALQNRQNNETAEMLGVRKQTVQVKKVPVQKPALPREHLLTEGFAQSQEMVMTIRTGELPPITNPSLLERTPRHYWRSSTYDQYMGTGWVTSVATPQNYKANTPLIPGLLDGYQPLHLDVRLYQPEGKLFWSGLLYSATVPFRADWRVRPQLNLFADQTALLQSDMFLAASGASSYEAETYIPRATVERLRTAPADYPEDIQARYLQLPRELPPRVILLSKEITAGLENPYDKAKAIESFLRKNYPYDLNVPAPPTDRDVTDYFLFDLKRGYCDYYATAMVVLARASGLPARFVSGYSPGSYDAPNAQYIVRELNAHSWAEVYFPEIGWIEFEPTASQPEIERVEKETQRSPAAPPATSTQKFLFKLSHTGVLYWISPFAIALLFVILYFLVLERAWVLRLAPSTAIELIYRRYYRMGRPIAGPRTRAETASEFTARLIHGMDEIRRRSKYIKPSPGFDQQAQQLTAAYLLSLFSRQPMDKKDAGRAFDLWKRLRRQIWIARFKKRFSR